MSDDLKKRVSDLHKLTEGFRLVLEGLGVRTDDHTRDTAERAARAWYDELCSSIHEPMPKVTMFAGEVDEMIILRGIPIRSVCAHHLLPFVGTAVIAYIPGRKEMLGLSKLSRLADWCARRPHVQELLTSQIADTLWGLVREWPSYGTSVLAGSMAEQEKGGAGVLIRANHMCMECRGVKHKGDMLTSALRGVFKAPEVRAEFLRLAGY